MTPTKINIPATLSRVSWIIRYQYLPYVINLAGKVFGITNWMIEDITLTELLKKVTHIQYVYPEMDGLSPARKWRNLRSNVQRITVPVSKGGLHDGETHTVDVACQVNGTDKVIGKFYVSQGSILSGLSLNVTMSTPGTARIQITNQSGVSVTININVTINIVRSPQAIVNSEPNDANYVVFGQMIEDGSTVAQAEQTLQLMSERIGGDLKKRFVISDYFAPTYGFSTNHNLANKNWVGAAQALQSQANARKTAGGSDGSLQTTSEFFTTGANTYRHQIYSGYLDSFVRTHGRFLAYEIIFNHSKHYIATSGNTMIITFSWQDQEGVSSLTTRSGGAYQKLRFSDKGGSIARHDRYTFSGEIVFVQTFWTILMGDGIVFWDGAGPMVSNPNAFNAGFNGPTKWLPDAGSEQTYNPNDPQQPAKVTSAAGVFPPTPQVGQTAAFRAAWVCSQIMGVSDRTSLYKLWATFTYVIDGVSAWGYYNEPAPANGSLGHARLNGFGQPVNLNEVNAINQCQFSKPIAILTVGLDGPAFVWHWPDAPLSKTVTVNVSNFGGFSVDVRGRAPQVFLLN